MEARWAVLLAFLRLSTQARIFEAPLALEQALGLVDGWLEQPCAVVVHPTDRHSALLRELLAPLGSAGNLTMDAHLAALAIEPISPASPACAGSTLLPARSRRSLRGMGGAARIPIRPRPSPH